MKKNKKPAAKQYMKTMGMVMASMMVLSTVNGQIVYAETAKDQKDVQDGEQKEEKTIVYLNGKSGNNKNSGESQEEAVKTFERAAQLAGEYGIIRICGTVTVEDEETWELPSGVSIRRADEYEGALVKVTGSLKLENVRLYTEDIIGDGEVEGAVEKEKVYVPKTLTVKEAKPLSEISLDRCEGDGVFSWKEEETVPSEYETVYEVIFHPYDTEKVDYSKEKGWDEKSETVTRKITVRVEALQLEVTPTPELTPTPEVTPAPEVTVTPEVTPEPTAAPEVSGQPETGQEPASDTDASNSSSNVEKVPEETAQTTPEVTPLPEAPVQPDDAGSSQAPLTPDTTDTPEPEVPQLQPGQPADGTGNIPDSSEKKEDTTLTWEQMNEISDVQNQLDFLPSEVTTPEEVEAIVAATKEYEALSDAQKAYIEADSLVLLQQAQEQAKQINRKSNGVTVDGDFPWYIQFQVQLNNDKTDASVLDGKNVDTFISPYEMRLWDLMNDCKYQLNGQQVRITMPAPDQQLYTQLVVVHYLEDESVEYITPIYNNDGTLSFVTTSFSPYNVAGLKLAGSQSLVGNTDKAYTTNRTNTSSGSSTKLTPNVSAGTTSGGSVAQSSSSGTEKKQTLNGQKTSSTGTKSSTGVSQHSSNPKTGDYQQTAWYAGLAAAALTFLGLTGKKSWKKENEK